MVLMFTWLSAAVVGPAVLAKRALKQGQIALARKNYAVARAYLEKAARHQPLREEAICLLAEASLYAGKPTEALYALNSLLLEQDQLFGRPRSPRVRLLRGIAGCMLGRPAAARRELAGIPRAEASIDDLLAAAQACVQYTDAAGAQQLLEALNSEPIEGPLAARVKLCQAALYYRLGAWEKSLESLPSPSDCSPPDAAVCQRVGQELAEKVRRDVAAAV
jgi:hypothetical protein